MLLQTRKHNSLASKRKWRRSPIIDKMDVGTTIFNEILYNSQMAIPVMTNKEKEQHGISISELYVTQSNVDTGL